MLSNSFIENIPDSTPEKKRRRPSVLNWSAFCSLVLSHAKETRAKGFTRVSKKQVQPWAERMVWEKIIKPMVSQMPSKGKTIFPPIIAERNRSPRLSLSARQAEEAGEVTTFH